MNKIKHVVTKVTSKPYYNYMWCVDVEANSHGSVQKTTVYSSSEEKANNINVGYEFEG